MLDNIQIIENKKQKNHKMHQTKIVTKNKLSYAEDVPSTTMRVHVSLCLYILMDLYHEYT